MKYLDYEKVLAAFLRTTGISENEFRHSLLIENAEIFVISHLSVPPEQLTAEQLSLCEQAAAAVAVYDYTFELCLKRVPVMSENGEVTMKTLADRADLAAVRELRRDSLNRLVTAGIGSSESFAFIKV